MEGSAGKRATEELGFSDVVVNEEEAEQLGC
jgi:hypothetical protein